MGEYSYNRGYFLEFQWQRGVLSESKENGRHSTLYNNPSYSRILIGSRL